MINLIAFLRKKIIKNKNYINCVMYGNKINNLNLKIINKNNYIEIFKKNLEINLIILNKKYYVKIKEIKLNPYKNSIIHIDFLFLNEEF